MIQSPQKIFAVIPYHSKSLSAETCLDQQYTAVVQEFKLIVFLFQGE